MKATPLALPEVVLLEPRVFADHRGYFFEAYNQDKFKQATGCSKNFVQDNQSSSSQGVLRGLHYQIGDHPQDKLVRVLEGEIFDVAVDIRRSSPTFGQWVGAYLSAENHHQLWVPEGFAHGFIVTSPSAVVFYKVTDRWDAAGERAIRWNDPELKIDWPCEGEPILAEKDAAAPLLDSAEVFA